MTTHVLLQSRQVPLEQILLGLLGLVAVVVVGLVIVSHVRRRLNATDDAQNAGGFMLSDLRRMHQAGQISDEEFERAKARVIDAAKRAAERDAAKANPAKRDDAAPGI